MKTIYLFLLFLAAVMSAAPIEVSGTVRSAADSGAVNVKPFVGITNY